MNQQNKKNRQRLAVSNYRYFYLKLFYNKLQTLV